jgi:sugar phosphate isomerase/epimerase
VNRRQTLAIVAGSATGLASTRHAGAQAATPKTKQRKVLWAANVRTKPLPERFEAARVGGFTHMSMFPIDFQQLLSAGQTHRGIQRQVGDSGIGIVACDPFTKFRSPNGYRALLQLRLPPGDGSVDIKSVLDVLRQEKAMASIGPEVF